MIVCTSSKDIFPLPFSAQEAAKLSSLQPELSSKGVPLYGIVHEEKGANSFNKYLNGQMLFDEEVWLSYMWGRNSNEGWLHFPPLG